MRQSDMMSDSDRIFQQVLGHYGDPSFVRRGRQVQQAFEEVVESCRTRREERLAFVRLPLGTLFALAGTVGALQEILDNSQQLATLTMLLDNLQPRLRLPPAPTGNRRVLRRAFVEVREAVERFNLRWQTYVTELDLRHVNEVRDNYNRFYLLEKECAVGSARVARQGFQRLSPLTPDDLLGILPLLPVL